MTNKEDKKGDKRKQKGDKTDTMTNKKGDKKGDKRKQKGDKTDTMTNSWKTNEWKCHIASGKGRTPAVTDLGDT